MSLGRRLRKVRKPRASDKRGENVGGGEGGGTGCTIALVCVWVKVVAGDGSPGSLVASIVRRGPVERRCPFRFGLCYPVKPLVLLQELLGRLLGVRLRQHVSVQEDRQSTVGYERGLRAVVDLGIGSHGAGLGLLQ